METHNEIPILDLGPEIEAYWNEYTDAFARVLKSAAFITGPETVAFEKEAAAYLGVKHAVGLNSGTDALIIGLRALGVGAGDEVITTGFTFYATSEACSLVGAIPRYVDIDPVSFNLRVDQIEKMITPKTKAIIPVHLFGQPADMTALLAVAKKHSLKVLEDVAQAWGSAYGGKRAGTMGDVGAFSFFPSKNLGAFGDGGLLTTNDDKIADQARMLRFHGSKKKYHNELVGYNSRLDSVQAAMLRVKLKHIDEFNAGRQEAAKRYGELFSQNPNVVAPKTLENRTHVFHQYTVRVKNCDRDQVHNKLAAAGIMTMIYYPVPVPRLPVYNLKLDLPETDKAAQEVLSLPIWPQIKPEQQLRVAEELKKAMA